MNIFKRAANAVKQFFAPKPKQADSSAQQAHRLDHVVLPAPVERLTVDKALAIAFRKGLRPKSIRRSMRRGAKWLKA